MAGDKDAPKIWRTYGAGGVGGYRKADNMTDSELAQRDARHKTYEDMLAKQQSYEDNIGARPTPEDVARRGCVFAKSCNLPDAIIDYSDPSGAVPTDSVKDYGDLVVLGGRDADENGWVQLKTVSGAPGPNMGSFTLAGPAITTATRAIAAAGAQAVNAAGSAVVAAATGVVVSSMVGIVSMLVPSNLGDSALYSEEQLRSLKQARTRVRLRVDEQADGSLKGYPTALCGAQHSTGKEQT